jgi:hypothetical protein
MIGPQNVNLITVVSDRILYHSRNGYGIITNPTHIYRCIAQPVLTCSLLFQQALVCCMLEAEYEIQNVVVISNVYTFINSVQTFTMEFNRSLTYHIIIPRMEYETFSVNWNIYICS